MMKLIILVALLSGVLCTNVYLDNFNQGTYDPLDPNSPYGYFEISPGVPANDGVIQQGNGFIVERAMPFTLTVPPGPFGGVDHVKNLKYLDLPFDPQNNKTLVYTLRFSGKTTGTENHPFGSAVTNDQDDIRLASVAQNMLDVRTFMVADFFLSNTGIWAFYERLPFGKGTPELGNYRAFSSTKRVATRKSDCDIHTLSIEYDTNKQEIRWYVEGKLVLKVDKIGIPSTDPNVKLILDHGGVDTIVRPLGFQVGFGAFTLLDMKDPLNANVNKGLVKINNVPGNYASPTSWVDNASLIGNRLFGQGSQMSVYKLKVDIK